MFRSPELFLKDLEQYYKLGFRPVLASEYISNKMPLPPGASPIVLTFDDSNPDQFQLKKDGSVDPKCAVGIWMKFAKDHPDFPVHGTYFVLPDVMWGPQSQVSKKLKILRALGSEIGNHSVNHPFLNRLSDKRVKWELGRATERLEKLGVQPPDLMALPYGMPPRNRRLLHGFVFHGKQVTFEAVFYAGGPPAYSPQDRNFNVLQIPRIVAGYRADSVQALLRRTARGNVSLYVQP